MKKLLTLLLIAFSITPFAQEIKDPQTPTDTTKKPLNPAFTNVTQAEGTAAGQPSPDAAGLGRYGEYGVDMANGLIPIQIPIYTVECGKLKLPISINYHSAGVKVNAIASSVGIDMSLFSGGVITRSVMGKPDEKQNGYLSTIFPLKSDETNQNTTFRCFIGKLSALDGSLMDGSPDQFFYNFNGKSGRFQLARRNRDGDVITAEFVTLPYKPIKISYVQSGTSGDIISFKIIDSDGTIYYFGKTSNPANYYTETTYGSTSGSEYISSWYLNKIESATSNDVIDFTYTAPGGILGKNILATSLNEITKNHNAQISVTYNYSRPQPEQYPEAIYPKEIFFKNGKVTFDYVNDRLDLKLGNSSSSRLSKISIFKKTNATQYDELKHFSLSHSYFDTGDGYSIAEKAPQLNTHDDTHIFRKLMRLDQVTEADPNNVALPPYKIKYIDDQPLSIFGGLGQDYWGYYNGKNGIGDGNRNRLLSVDADIAGPISPNNPYTSSSGLSTSYGVNREPDPAFGKRGLIREIVYPTGGKTKFEFQANQSNGGTIGGGFRILSTSNYKDETDDLFINKTVYNYIDAYSVNNSTQFVSSSTASIYQSMASENFYPQGGGSAQCVEYSYRFVTENLNFMLGSGASNYAYSQVEVVEKDQDDVENGKTVKIFEQVSDVNLTFIKLNPSNPNSNVVTPTTGNYYAIPPITNDWRRGLLRFEKHYKGTTLLKETEYLYTEFLPDYISFAYMAKVLYKPFLGAVSSGCDASRTAYSGNALCPGPADWEFASTNHAYEYQRLDTEIGYKKLTSTIETNYDEGGNNGVVTTTTFAYNPNHKRQQLTSKTMNDSQGRSLVSNYQYPNDFAGLTYASMVLDNILEPVVKETVTRGGLAVSETKRNYAYFGSYPQIQTEELKVGSGTNRTMVTYNSYDTAGNLTGLTQLSGQKLSFTYFGASDYGKTDLLKTISIAGGTAGDKLLRTETYNYQPLVGISSFFDINGNRTVYNYDNFLRLSTVIDDKNYYIGKKFYHFSGQTLPTGLGASPSAANNFTATARAITEQNSLLGGVLSTDVDLTSLNINYSDGLGRPAQSVIWKGSPDKTKDILTNSIEYDTFGRATKSIIPAPSNVNTGDFNATHESLANTFYSDNKPYNLVTLESSPLNRPKELLGAGQNWHTGNKAKKINYSSAGNTVAKYVVSGSGATSSQNYAANTLFLTTLEDEMTNETAEYKDTEGNTLLVSRKVNADTTLYTTYIYDEMSRLRYTLMPEAYGTTSFSESDAIFTNHIYAYHYDSKGRMDKKHIPGAGWTSYIFDKKDQIVLSQNDKEKAENRYNFTKYDALSRPVQSGILNTSADQSTIQTAFDDFTGVNYETQDNEENHWYSEVSFPTDYKPGLADFRLVNFYDNYSFEGVTGFVSGQSPHTQGNSVGFLTGTRAKDLVNATATWYTNTSYYDYLGRQIQEHIGNHAGTDRADITYRYDGAVLNTKYTHNSTTVQNTITYDHQARPLSSTHTIGENTKTLATYGYDQLGRNILKTVAPGAATFGGEPAVSSVTTGLWPNGATWNTGQEPCGGNTITISPGNIVTVPDNYVAKTSILEVNGTLHFGNLANLELYPINNTSPISISALQKIQYRYNTRNWLTDINPTALESEAEADLFSYNITYLDNGNISSNSWASPTNKCVNTLQNRSYEYTYDMGSRLRFAKYTGQGDYSISNVQYTNNGNIQKLQRKGRLADGNPGLIDNLTYTYAGNGNKIESITDGVTTDNKVDFVKGTGNYVHNADGSLATDPNENTSITYDDFLSQPKAITAGSASMSFTYKGDGSLLKATDKNGDEWEYFGPMTYKNGVLFEITTPEGRAINHNSNYTYEFDHTDHLGNKRVSFTGFNNQLAVTSVQDFDPFGVLHAGNSYANGLIDRNSYQGKTKEQGLNRIDLGFRTINPTTGIFDRADPLAELDVSQSPFSYVRNNPLSYIDLMGLTADSLINSNEPGMLPGANSDKAKSSSTREPIPMNASQWPLYGAGSSKSGSYNLNNSPNVKYAQTVASPNTARQSFPDRYGNYQQLARGNADSDYTIESVVIPIFKGIPLLWGKIFTKPISNIIATGEGHHLLSNKIMNALNVHPTLSGVFKRNDPNFIYKAFDKTSHKGYQKWHRIYDEKVVRFIQSSNNIKPAEFKNFLNKLYSEKWLQERIPNVKLK